MTTNKTIMKNPVFLQKPLEPNSQQDKIPHSNKKDNTQIPNIILPNLSN